MAGKGLLSEESGSSERTRGRTSTEISKAPWVSGDRDDHVLDIGDHAPARRPDPIPLGVVLAGPPEQTEEEVSPPHQRKLDNRDR